MLQFMKNKILIPLSILALLVAFFSFKYVNGEGNNNESKRVIIQETIMAALTRGHFSPRSIDDSLSYKVYHKVLESLDYDKKFFTQEDIDYLNQFELKIDDEIKEGSVAFFDALDSIFLKRIDGSEKLYKEILKQPFQFDGNDSIQLNGAKLDYAANDAALKNRWHQFLKYRVLAKYVDLKNDQEKTKKDKDFKRKTDVQLEADARESVMKNQDFFFKRLRRLKADERFAIYMNSITNVEDPHTDYFPPKDKAMFDESMSGNFVGIGAQLQEEEGKIKVVAILPGTPCAKQGELKAGDVILKVAQGKAEPVDIQGYEIDDAVKIIRGKKGTEVRLTVRKIDGSIRTIPIIRDKVEREETFAKSALINTADGKVGYIYLPEFYADFNNPNGRRCAVDVATEVKKLKAEGVKGIILDLRNNGGGSLQDVVDMGGLFIDEGPIVQVKTSGETPEKLYDRDKGILYDGPLAIMVNQGSASASEILAAAMQDYKRAIIVGSTTFGKGTVQRIISLDDMLRYSNRNIKDTIGALKITVQKFYRINGGSTQLKGVEPDITMPDIYQHIDIGERRDKSALKWDEIPAADYAPVAHPINVPMLTALSNKRMEANTNFQLIEQNAQKLKEKEEDNSYPLNEKAFRKELEAATASSKKMEELEKKAVPLKITNPKADAAYINRDSTTIARNEAWLKLLKKDIYLSETVNVVNDMYKNSMKLNLGTGMR